MGIEDNIKSFGHRIYHLTQTAHSREHLLGGQSVAIRLGLFGLRHRTTNETAVVGFEIIEFRQGITGGELHRITSIDT